MRNKACCLQLREAFRVRLCEWCKKQGWNSRDLARHLGVSPVKVWYWMTPKTPRVPNYDGLRLLSEAGFSVSGPLPAFSPRIRAMIAGWSDLSPEDQSSFCEYANYLIGGQDR
jgi:transcriptional regulator with XRE-family HTH domain